MDVDARERRPGGGGRRGDAPPRGGTAQGGPVSTPPVLRMILGSKEGESALYRLRATSPTAAPAPAEWPQAGAWRQLVHRLQKT